MRQILLFLMISQLLHGCASDKMEQRYQYIGQASFRNSYAGHENFTEKELKSAQKANPSLMIENETSEDSMLAILIESGMATKKALLLDKISFKLKDTIFLSTNHSNTDTLFIDYHKNKDYGTASIKIRNGKMIDSIPIKHEVFSHTFSLLKLSDVPKSRFAFVYQYYIMNGDNYEVSIYETK